jgi:tetratricopeptide (TPR) repeat protein
VAYVWDVETGGGPRVLAGHSRAPIDLAFTPDSRRVAILSARGAGRGSEVKVWDPATGQEVLSLTDPEPAQVVRFAADGRTLYVFGPAGRRAYDATPLPPDLEAPDVVDQLGRAATHDAVVAQLDKLALAPELKAKAAELARLQPSRLGDTASIAAIYQPGRPAAEYQRALADSERVRGLRPTGVAAWYVYGGVLYRLARYDEALRALTHAEDLDRQQNPNPGPHAPAFLAMTYHRLGQTEKARAALARMRKQLKVEPWAAELQGKPVQAFFAEVEALLDPKK